MDCRVNRAIPKALPDTEEPSSVNNRKIIADVTGDWTGRSSAGGPLKKIEQACCEIRKLGANTLWIHTTYPRKLAP